MTTSSPDVARAGGPPPALAAHRLTKRFPGGVVANEDVDFEVRPGEVHALLGENGAGKSTLSNMLTGLYRPDGGTIRVRGEVVDFASPRDAIAAGIGMVHQHFHLVKPFTVAENLALGGTGPVSRRKIARRVRELGETYGLDVNPSARIWQLSIGEQQRVEILKALARDADILILDEPTAVLTPQEADSLFVVLRRMADEGRSVVFISHKLDEVRAVADRVTVLRAGRSEGTTEVGDTDSRTLARLMVGRDVSMGDERTPRASGPTDEVALRVSELRVDNDRGRASLDGVDLTVHRGEILGVCGVAGNGQRALAEAVAGMRATAGGSVEIAGKPLRSADPRKARTLGLTHIPEDRLHTGLAPDLSVEDNLALIAHRRPPLAAGPFLKRGAIRRRADELVEAHDIRTPSTTTRTGNLSGGNIQKILLAREVAGEPAVIVAASPTRGLDVGASASVRGELAAAADRGAGILLLSEDLDEVLALSDRIATIYEGRIVGVVDRREADITQLGLWMGGDETVDGTDHGDGDGHV